MPGPPTKNTACVVKTFRFKPDLMEDMERVIYLSEEGGKAKYPSMTNFIAVALGELIRKERRELEQEGVVWEHLKHDFKKSINQEKVNESES